MFAIEAKTTLKMDGFETPYEDYVDVDFINCEICNKSIRGETLYKLHVTTPAHIKNEETLIAEGKIPRQQRLPVFDNILQYLEYLKIDEPIVGLSCLEEIPSDTGDLWGIKYSCTLCKVFAYLTEAVQHVIGRKHRQRYLETYRPDLISWDFSRPQTISGKIVRARAEVAERQDGQGMPKFLPGELKSQLYTQGSSFTKDMEANLSNFGNLSKGSGRQVSDDFAQKRYEDDFANRAPVRDREIFTEHYEQDRDALDFSTVREYGHKDSEDFSNVLSHQDQDRRQYGHSDAFRKPPQKDVLKEFYTEELRREQLAKHSQNENTKTTREVGTRPIQSSYSTSDGKNSHNYKLGYKHEDRPHESLSNFGQNRVSPSRPIDGISSTKLGNIPDPFMRFLKGERSHEVPKERKRKSRFSDATGEELQTAREMFAGDYGPPNPKCSSLGPEIRKRLKPETDPPSGLKQTDIYQMDPQPECLESAGDIFEMLKNIEIENEDEANFLKDRICQVLREFKARKAEKAMHARPSTVVKDYGNMRQVTVQHTQDRFERIPRENEDNRRAVEPYDRPRQDCYDEQRLHEDYQQHKYRVPPEERYSNRKTYKDIKTWPNTSQPQHDPDYGMRDPGYDLSDLGSDMPAPDYNVPATAYDVPPSDYDMAATFPEKFEEPLRRRDYQSHDNFPDYQSSASPLHMERGPRMNRPPQYSRNLDKITSTLLELVKRK